MAGLAIFTKRITFNQSMQNKAFRIHLKTPCKQVRRLREEQCSVT